MKNKFSRQDIRNLQDVMADNGYIVGITQRRDLSVYVYNEYLGIGIFIDDIEPYHVMLEYRDALDRKMATNRWLTEDKIYKQNYYQWCKIIHKRTDWLDDARFELWAKEYRLYKLEKVFED